MSKTITIRHQIGFHMEYPDSSLKKRPQSIGTLQPGTVVPISMEMEGIEFEKELSFIDLKGDIKKHNVKSNIWHQDLNGWWYWNGATFTLEDAEELIGEPAPSPVIPEPILAPEKTFDWAKIMKKSKTIPASWFKNKGKGVNIAIIDAGFDLNDPCFSHLSKKIKTYDLRNSIYNNPLDFKDSKFIETLNGTDKLPSNIHGSSCLGILAAKHPNKELIGIAPEANYHLFNIYEHNIGPFNSIIIRRSIELFKKAILLISQMDIDIVSVSVSMPNDISISDELINQVLKSKGIWFWALKSRNNPSLDKYVLEPTYPNPFFNIQKIATLKQEDLQFPESLVIGEMEKSSIDFIIQKSTISVSKGNRGIDHKSTMQCSYATPLLSGLAALKLNEEKKSNTEFKLNPEKFIKEFQKEVSRFYTDYIPDNDEFTFLRLNEKPIV